MPETTKQVRRGGKQATDVADDARSNVEEAAGAAGEDRPDEAASDGHGRSPTITAELKDAVREAAIEVLRPVMRKATTSAAKYAVTQGPTLVKDKVAPKVQDLDLASKGSGVVGAVGGVASGIGGKLGAKKKEGESPGGTGRGRRLPVQELVDVGVDLETAYNQFTQFEDWPQFMHRVERIEQRDDTTLMWHENIWGVRRSWEAEITDQTPCERIAWRSASGPQSVGVVTFHPMSDRLTRIYVTMDFQPQGLFEKAASGMRISRRALKSDLMRFKAFIELRDDATGGWGGRIDDGEVRGSRDEDEPQVAEDEDDEEYAEDEEREPQAAEDDDYVDEDEDEEEEPSSEAEDEEEADEKPRPRRRRKVPASSGRSAR